MASKKALRQHAKAEAKANSTPIERDTDYDDLAEWFRTAPRTVIHSNWLYDALTQDDDDAPIHSAPGEWLLAT